MSLKKITLHGPTVRNDGGYLDSGSTVEIGDKPDQIAADRGRDLVRDGIAVSETAARAEAKDAEAA